jgi:lysophospholipase L1-like esterase
MKNILAIGLTLLLMAFTQNKAKKIIFFGDSITQQGVGEKGYITKLNNMLLQKGLQRSYELVGAGIGGNKIYDLYLRLDSDVLAQKPDVVVIFIGVNDVWHKRGAGTGTDADKFEKFYQATIDKIKNIGAEVILATPACIGERTDHSNDQDGDLNFYAKIIRSLAQKNSLKIVDLRQKFLEYNLNNNPDNKDRGILTTDRVHLNETGNQLVADAFWNELVK